MEGSHSLKFLLAGMIAVLPLIAGAQTTDSTGSLLFISGETLSLGAASPLAPPPTLVLSNSIDTGLLMALPAGPTIAGPGNLGLLAGSIHSNGIGGIGIGTLTGTLTLNPGDPLTIAPVTNQYSFGTVTTQRGGSSSGATLSQLHGVLSGSLGAMNNGTIENPDTINQASPIPNLTVVPEPGVTALLVLGGLGFAARIRAKRH